MNNRMKKTVYKIINRKTAGLLFLGLLILGMVCAICLPDRLLSNAERRTLATLPELSWESILDKGFSDELETYFLEQFPGRDIFRTIKAEFDTKILGKTDSNGYTKVDNHLLQVQTTYDKAQVDQAALRFQNIVETYFPESEVYYGIIPDKNYFLEEVPGYDYDYVVDTFAQVFGFGTEIELEGLLTLDDYYDTDLHAKQEALLPLANGLLLGMGSEEAFGLEDYEQVLVTDEFYGGYSAASAYMARPDSLYYLTNGMLEEATVYDYETNTLGGIYTLDKLDGMDPYDIFLGGARALLKIDNPEIENGKKLIIFRDSFGSSIAPLLLVEYEEIVLVDLRYVSVSYAMNLLESGYDDVLFLYQVQVLYNSNSFSPF